MKLLPRISLGSTTTISTSILRCLMLEENNTEETRHLKVGEKLTESLPRKKIAWWTVGKGDATELVIEPRATAAKSFERSREMDVACRKENGLGCNLGWGKERLWCCVVLLCFQFCKGKGIYIDGMNGWTSSTWSWSPASIGWNSVSG